MPMHQDISDEAAIEEAYETAAESTLFARIAEDLFSRFNGFGTTFDPNPNVAAFNEGQRSVVIYLLERVSFAKTGSSRYMQMSEARRLQNISMRSK